MAGNLFGGITNFLSGGKQAEASQNSQNALASLQGVDLPSVEEMQIQLQEMIQQGTITPEAAQTILMERSSMNEIETDPALKQNQLDALNSLVSLAQEGGMTDQDRANLSKIKTDENTNARGQREAILQSAQSRGLGGSGIELMNALQNQQNSATRQSQRDMDVAGQAQARALESLQQAGNLSGNMQNQSFNQQAQVANANDAISKFNAANQQQQVNTNTAARNAAQVANLGEKQRIADANTQMKNQQQQYNKGLLQQDFQNRIQKAGGIASQNQALAAQNTAQGAQNLALIGGLVESGAKAASGGAAPAAAPAAAAAGAAKKSGGLIEGEPSDYDSIITPTQPGEFVVRKEDVPDFLKKAHTDENGEFDVSGFLDSITGHKYSYAKGRK